MDHLILAVGEQPDPLVPVPIEIILQVVVLGILYVLIRRFVVPQFEKTFHDRTTAIEGGLLAAESKQEEADAKLAELERQLSEARHEAARIREDAREQGTAIITEMREEAQSQSQRIVDQGRTQIEAERQQAVATLRAEVGQLATSLAGKIVGESLEDEARQSRVVERFLGDLEAQETLAGRDRNA